MVANLLAGIPARLDEELVEVLARSDEVRIERIVSRGHASPEGFWYDQQGPELVVLVAGSARLAFEDGEAVSLAPGDWLVIPAHRRHRVERTAADGDTVWLAVHYR